MKHLNRLVIVVVLLLSASLAQAQDAAEIPASEYLRLIKATRFIENLKEMAEVSSKVFGARGQGSDDDYARFMSIVATADLSDVSDCIVAVYKTQELSRHDIVTLVSFFESPLGVKLLEQSQKMIIADIEQGSHQPTPPDVFTEEEKQGIQEIQQNTAYQKYALMTADREFHSGIMKCIAESSAVKKAGIKF